MRILSVALRLVKKLCDEAASKGSSAVAGPFSATSLSNAVLSREDKYEVLQYIETAAEHSKTESREQHLVGVPCKHRPSCIYKS